MISVSDIKTALRISHNMLDKDIKRNIGAALFDMNRVGIDIRKKNPLIDKACELYCKSQYDFQGKGEQYRKLYEGLRDSLSLAGDYRV